MNVRAPLHRSNASMSLRISCIQKSGHPDPREWIGKGRRHQRRRIPMVDPRRSDGRYRSRRYSFYVVNEMLLGTTQFLGRRSRRETAL
jgi:hypothetical protein